MSCSAGRAHTSPSPCPAGQVLLFCPLLKARGDDVSVLVGGETGV